MWFESIQVDYILFTIQKCGLLHITYIAMNKKRLKTTQELINLASEKRYSALLKSKLKYSYISVMWFKWIKADYILFIILEWGLLHFSKHITYITLKKKSQAEIPLNG